MAVIDPVVGEILISFITIVWGIFVETWFVSRWTIFFNIVTLIAVLATLDLSGQVVGFLVLFLILSFGAVGITGHQVLKQFVGAKAYGTITIAIGFAEKGWITDSQILPAMFIIAMIVGVFAFMVWWAKVTS